MNILLLGGTQFLGRCIARKALHSGHSVTCLARGTNAPVNGTHFVRSDRDRDDALEAVGGQHWHSIVDLTSHPVHARHAAARLKADHVVYVSSSSVYEQQQDVNSEQDPVVRPLEVGYLQDPQDYPAAKSACEATYVAGYEYALIVRPGLIAGFGDETGRSGYYPWRFLHLTGEDALVPDLTFPVAMIDAEDLAEWIIDCIERGVTGVFNATGERSSIADVVGISQAITASTARARVVSDADLMAQGVVPWMGENSLPLWIPGRDLRDIAILDCARARANGLVTRPLHDTLAAALKYEVQRGGPTQAGLSDSKEPEIRASLVSSRG